MLTPDVMAAIRRRVDRQEDNHPATVTGIRILIALIIVIAIVRYAWPD